MALHRASAEGSHPAGLEHEAHRALLELVGVLLRGWHRRSLFSPQDRTWFRGLRQTRPGSIVEGFLAQSADFVVSPGRKGWDHEQPSILMAQGHSSVMVAELLRRFVVPALGDLSARLDDERAAFLDIGAGVAALAVAMCRLWPSLRVVGIDPWAPALALARERVSEAGLEERIELRQAVAETLDDQARYDLAWVPTFFISGTVLDRVIERVHAALRPGGWATLGLYAAPDIPLAGAVTDLRTVRHGGAMQTPQEMAAQMVRAGFSDVDVLFDAAWGRPMMFVAGRRTEAS